MRRIMRKYILFASAVVCLAFAGCSSVSEKASTKTKANVEKNATITNVTDSNKSKELKSVATIQKSVKKTVKSVATVEFVPAHIVNSTIESVEH